MIQRENPARTDEVVATVPVATADDVDAVVTAADAAQRTWRAVPVAERAAVLLAAADALAAEVDAIAEAMARETGKVLGDARGEAGFAVHVLRFYAGRAPELLAEEVRDDERGRLVVRHRPYGVVAAVTPWNAPLILTMLKLAPGLVAGNALVVKPSPLAPVAVARMVEVLATHLPAGLVAVVQGGAETATALVTHPRTAKVAFTGGDVAGRAIAATASQALVPSVLELGGNDAAVLLDDVALSEADAERLVMAAFATSGQVCMAIKRLYVHRSRLDEVLAAIRAAADRVLCVGDPLHEGSTMGPVVSAESAQRLRALLAAALADGGEAIELGGVNPRSDLSRGHFVRPVLVTGLDDAHPLVAAEQFGPILPVLAFDSVEEVVERANATDLGLGASVWSADEERAFEVAARLEAGFTFINTHNRTGMALDAPFGGIKGSGWGREYGDEGLMEYVQPCVINAPGAFRAGGSGLGAAAYPTA
ncbi:aldehyde dehydrogenase family protein [Nocardioides sp. zg-536]|uniref:Aldehyde dehydrogenase family protein n=1 Tax=Nocardioides faecalis TaxID=2803858 RepID=A0A938Y6L9_9ACTN|nr:aldehyde dehydrogenase family protein [Nocardioides faecalis]MBM9459188.1 aldehyde dehydrogenase family protein [Nocardioides faecalis]QVI59672.1 aldehyde dehydrogenase family protein [Nocardioides faecalis]